MTKLNLKNTKQELYSEYCLQQLELDQLKRQLRPKASLSDVTKAIHHNLKDDVLSNNIKSFVSFVASYLVYLFVIAETIFNKVATTIKTLKVLLPQSQNLSLITIRNHANHR